MVSSKNFFKEKKGWSKYKDNILSYYLKPYLSKILSLKNPLVIIDGFAGCGLFEDGEKGSPLIISDSIKHHLQNDRKIDLVCIENKYYNKLQKNTSDVQNIKIIQSAFEDSVNDVCNIIKGNNVFLYIDPYGVKSLNINLFRQITSCGCNAVEMLMNFNAFGFLREGCRLLKYEGKFDDNEINVEYEEDEIKNIDIWNSIADGDYWQSILEQYNNGKINMLECEKVFVKEYESRLRKIFKYVIDIPIKEKEKNIPKYRLIFATNHPDGLFLMTDNMNKAMESMKEMFLGTQTLLFDYDLIVNENAKEEIKKFILFKLENNENCNIKDFIIYFIQKYGVQFSVSEYKEIFVNLEREDKVSIIRNPAFTKTGKPAVSMDFDKYEIRIKKYVAKN